jgi:hypothetical protein
MLEKKLLRRTKDGIVVGDEGEAKKGRGGRGRGRDKGLADDASSDSDSSLVEQSK